MDTGKNLCQDGGVTRSQTLVEPSIPPSGEAPLPPASHVAGSPSAESRGYAFVDLNRKRFEAWILSPPYERSVARWPTDDTKYAWPGQYCDIVIQIAWESWMESITNHKP